MTVRMSYAADITFGHISSLTNPSSAEIAKQLRSGIKLAFDEANANGGINGNQLKLDARDDSQDPAKMAAFVNELIADPKIIGMIGNLGTAGLTELSKNDVYGKNGIALIAPFQGSRAIVEATNVFPFRSSFDDEVLALLKLSKTTFKANIAIVHYDIAFGPGSAKFAKEQADSLGIQVVSVSELSAKPNADFTGSVAKALDSLRASKPDTVLLLAGGKFAFDFVSALRKSNISAIQIYALSAVVPQALVSSIGQSAARGIVLSQATPYPFVASSPLAREYHAALRKFSPDQEPTFVNLEGYIAGKIATLALNKVSSNYTRSALLSGLNSIGRFDLGGPIISYSKDNRRGWGGTDLVIINRDGKLVR